MYLRGATCPRGRGPAADVDAPPDFGDLLGLGHERQEDLDAARVPELRERGEVELDDRVADALVAQLHAPARFYRARPPEGRARENAPEPDQDVLVPLAVDELDALGLLLGGRGLLGLGRLLPEEPLDVGHGRRRLGLGQAAPERRTELVGRDLGPEERLQLELLRDLLRREAPLRDAREAAGRRRGLRRVHVEDRRVDALGAHLALDGTARQVHF